MKKQTVVFVIAVGAAILLGNVLTEAWRKNTQSTAA